MGRSVGKLPDFAADVPSLIALYRAMVLTRTFDLKAVSLQRTGRLGTYAVSLGQEAVSVGVASAMRPEDVLLPSYRDNGTLLWRGVKMEEILLYWGGDERGNLSSGPAHDFPFCVPVGSQAPHAAGVAYAFKFRKEPRVAVCLLGDGATSKGDVYEAMNFAGVQKLPARVRRQQQPVGHLGAAQAADGMRDAGAEGDRRGLPGRAGGRQRRHRRARRRRAGDRGCPQRQGTAPDRGPHLSARRPHDGG